MKEAEKGERKKGRRVRKDEEAIGRVRGERGKGRRSKR